MKKIIGIICFACFSFLVQGQTTENKNTSVDTVSQKKIVEASCGTCKLGLKGKGCALAVRIDGKSYFVDGPFPLDSFGDAHGADGMCNIIRKAEVSGEIKDDRFIATSFKLLPVEKATN